MPSAGLSAGPSSWRSSVTLPSQHASAEPMAECPLADAAGLACAPAGGQPTAPGNVGTVVHVVIHRSFAETSTPDQCVGSGALEPVQRGSSALLSDGSLSVDSGKVAVGVFIRSRMKDGMCEVLYIASAPVPARLQRPVRGTIRRRDRQLRTDHGGARDGPGRDSAGVARRHGVRGAVTAGELADATRK